MLSEESELFGEARRSRAETGRAEADGESAQRVCAGLPGTKQRRGE